MARIVVSASTVSAALVSAFKAAKAAKAAPHWVDYLHPQAH
jgi:hypothetical protein